MISYIFLYICLVLFTFTALFPVITYYLYKDNWEYFWLGDFVWITTMSSWTTGIVCAVFLLSSYRKIIEKMEIKKFLVIYLTVLVVICVWHIIQIWQLKQELPF